MALLVPAQVIRDLIIDGSYAVECIEQRDHGRVAVMLVLKSRAQPITMQIETTDHKLAGLFRALVQDTATLQGHGSKVKLGDQAVPVIDVDTLPADQLRAPRRKPRQRQEDKVGDAEPRRKRGERRRAGLRQLILMPQDAPARVVAASESPKARTRSRVSNAKAEG